MLLSGPGTRAESGDKLGAGAGAGAGLLAAMTVLMEAATTIIAHDIFFMPMRWFLVLEKAARQLGKLSFRRVDRSINSMATRLAEEAWELCSFGESRFDVFLVHAD
ncbi:hypothetical protein V6N13_126051 [Hibiscus sabdariffa]